MYEQMVGMSKWWIHDGCDILEYFVQGNCLHLLHVCMPNNDVLNIEVLDSTVVHAHVHVIQVNLISILKDGYTSTCITNLPSLSLLDVCS